MSTCRQLTHAHNKAFLANRVDTKTDANGERQILQHPTDEVASAGTKGLCLGRLPSNRIPDDRLGLTLGSA